MPALDRLILIGIHHDPASPGLHGRSSTPPPAVKVGWGRAAREPTGTAGEARMGMAWIIHEFRSRVTLGEDPP
jgi:hypothetical protein